MRNRKALPILITILFIASIFLCCATAQAETGRVGYVNLSLIFDSYAKTKDYDKKLESDADGKRKEREKLVNDIKKLRDEIELLSEDKRADQQRGIDDKVKELQAFDRDARENLRRQRDAMLREILKEIDNVVKEFGDTEGYDYIFNDRVLIYKNESQDLSRKIIEKLNAKN